MENNKEYYTFAELIDAMRKEYIKNQQILDKLYKRIEVSSEFKTESELQLVLGYNNENCNQPVLLLHISKKPESIDTLIRSFKNKREHFEPRLKIDNAVFKLVEQENTQILYFKLDNRLNLKYAFNPKITVNNPNEFYNTYQELKQSKLFNLTSLYFGLNPYQSVYIDSNSIQLQNIDENGKEINIMYNAKTDSIEIKTNISYSTYFIEQLLETEIPKYKFTNKYRDFLDKNNNNREMVVDDIVGKRKENLQIEENIDNEPKKLILKRKI